MSEPRELDQYQTDHDLLVTLNERMSNVSKDIGKLTEAAQIKNEDHEKRIRLLETTTGDMQSSARTWRFAISIAFSVVGLGLTIIGILLAFFH
jgi:hypothetical protein